MKLYEYLVMLAGAAPNLIKLLEDLAAKVPDLAPVCEKWIELLKQAPDAVNLAAVGAAIPGELLNIVQGQISPHDHPSDAI